MLPTVEESRGYDFQDPENAEKWRGLFVNSLRKVVEQVHPTLRAEDSALEYVESLCLRLLAMLCAAPSPLTVQDVEERVARTFPTPLDKWALCDARDAASQRRRRAILPIDKIHHLLQKEVLLYKIDMSVSVFITAILEYVSADILKLAGNFVKKISQKSGYDTVTSRDIKTAMCADKVLMDMFYQDSELLVESTAASAGDKTVTGRKNDKRPGTELTYNDLVKELMTDEKQFLRELNLIIRVFKDEMDKILEANSRAITLIFGNIVDIYELTVTLLGNLEDACEAAEDTPESTPSIGACFEELAEVEEFRAYVRYAHIVTKKESREELQRIVDDPQLGERLETAGHGFRLAVKYYLPRLLLAPLAHVFLYHSYVLALLQVSTNHDDRECFKQVECNLHPIKKLLMTALGNGPKMDATLRMATRARRQLAIEKCNELSKIVDNWDRRDIGQCCNEFIREDTLSKIGPGKRIAERRAYLFDGLLLLCKPVTSLVAVNTSTLSSAGGAQQLKLKERLHIRKLDLVDRADNEECRNAVELWPRVGGAVVLACASVADKRHWMADLVMLNTKPMLDRSLDSILLDLEKKHPLRLPPVELYRFAIPDTPENIILEERGANTTAAPNIKGATLLKLVERLTYHVYADLNLVRTFITTYRSFCAPHTLLDLLIERFQVPEPQEVYTTPQPEESIEVVGSSDADKLSKNTAREDWKRYRKEFLQPVKFRVINVLRHWVDQHFYDFERDPTLLEKLRNFLESVDGKPMRKWVQSVLKTLQRKSEKANEPESATSLFHIFNRSPPAVLRHVADPEKHGWHPLALHPLELARQLTLLEFQLYRLVRPSELVGAVWTKKDKERSSPNLLKIIKHTTNFTRWMERWIVESENLEERVAVVCRFLELAAALRDLNNFNGVLAVVAACGSAAVHRLKTTFQMVNPRLVKLLEEFRALNSDHFKVYCSRLRSINPPCVPFFGIYLTNILHIEEGNLDYLPNSELINFSKRRKVAEITGEIQQYQNQPYCLTVEPKTRAFLDSLDPFPGMDDNEITNYLYSKSLEIEPRPPVKQMPKFPRKYPELSLKPVKVSRRTQQAEHNQQPTSHQHNNDDTLSVSQLSPTNSNWDGQSVASLPIHHDDHRGSKSEDRGSLISPRLERCSSNTFSQLSLFDKGLALFDKSKSTATLTAKGSKEEPASPRDRHSPRHDRTLPQGERKALSPRGAIVDAELFYSTRSIDHLTKKQEQERVPPLLPRNSVVCNDTEPPPVLPRRDQPSISSNALCSELSEPLPPPAAPPPASPRNPEIFRATVVPAMSPKRSPAPQPPASPLRAADRASAFNFPSSPPAPPLTPHPPAPSSKTGTPPPLPPRRRKDSIAPTTPHHMPSSASPQQNDASVSAWQQLNGSAAPPAKTAASSSPAPLASVGGGSQRPPATGGSQRPPATGGSQRPPDARRAALHGTHHADRREDARDILHLRYSIGH
ncbi:rasGEF domain-containing protein [Phthorimaea operculella]|nr:rasGEF domain-containing protein [Phthorimaea operculella]